MCIYIHTNTYTQTRTRIHTNTQIQAGKAEARLLLPSEIPAVQRARPEYLSSHDTDVVLSEKIGFERSFVCTCVCVCVCVYTYRFPHLVRVLADAPRAGIGVLFRPGGRSASLWAHQNTHGLEGARP